MDQDDRRSFGFLFEVENLIANCYSNCSVSAESGEKRTLKEFFSTKRRLGVTRLPFGQQLSAAAYSSASANLAIFESHLSQIGESDIRSPIDMRSGLFAVFARLSTEKRVRRHRYSQQEQLLLVCAFILEHIASAVTRSTSFSTTDSLYHGLLSKLLIAQEERADAVQTAILPRNGRKTSTNSRVFQSACYEWDLHELLKSSFSEPRFAQILRLSCDLLSGNERGGPGKFFAAGIGSLAMGNVACQASQVLPYSSLLQNDSEIEEKFVNLPKTVRMKPLLLQHENFNLIENVDTQPWHQNEYISCSPRVLKISNAIVHGSVGIVCFGDRVIEESLWHTDPRRHRYDSYGGKVRLFAKTVEDLKGLSLAILTGSAESYWHTLVDAVARLAIIPHAYWSSIDRVLYPSTGVRIDELLDLYDLPKSLEKRIVYPHETFRIQHFLYPSSIHGLFDYHPGVLREAFGSIVRRAGSLDGPNAGEFLYIERGPSALRPLLNEDEVIACLPEFRPVRLENMTILEQVRLFSKASVIVAPHGAGLSNIVFAPIGCAIVEIMMDRYCNWCYRRIANILEKDYNCVVGRAQTLDGSIHAAGWTVDVKEVRVSVEIALKVAGHTS